MTQATHDLPPAWVWVCLKDLAELKGGITKGQRRKASQSLRSVPYLRVANVQRGFLDLGEVREIEATEEEIAELRLQEGDVLFNEGGDRDKLGRGWIWRGELPECIHQNHVFRARIRAGVADPKYISWYGNSVGRSYFIAEGKQTTNLASLNLTKLGQLPVKLPPLAEQRRIVAAIEEQFTRLEAAVASLERARGNLKRHRAAVTAAAVAGRLVPASDGEAQRGASLSNSVPTDTLFADIGQLPSGWSWSTLGELATYLRNGIGIKPDADRGTPVLRISAVRPMKVNMEDVRFFSQPQHELCGYTVEAGDLLFTRYNGNPELVGVCGMVRRVDQPTVHPDKLIRVKVDRRRALPEFLEVALNTGVSRSALAQRVRTTAGQSGVSGSDLRAIPVPLPPLDEQQRIADEVERRLSVIEGTETSVETNLKRAERLRQAILKRAFEGKLVSQDPTDEPASVLLERIRNERATSVGTARQARRTTTRVKKAPPTLQAPLPI